jgi:hypothetical protein
LSFQKIKDSAGCEETNAPIEELAHICRMVGRMVTHPNEQKYKEIEKDLT